MNPNDKNLKKGFAGKLAEMFVHSKLTPVIALVSLLLGIGAVFFTPKEEEPQISVPMIDIMTGAPGFNSYEVERKVTEVIERAVWGLEGVEYVYSASEAHGSIVTVRFKVGEPMEPSLVKIHHKLMTLKNELPANVMPSQVKSFTIDDVPFLTITFSSNKINDYELRTLVGPLARELQSTPDLSKIEILGGLKRSIRVIADENKLKNLGVSLQDLAMSLKANSLSIPAGKNWSETKVYDIEAGGKLESLEDIKSIAIGQRGGRIVKLKDVATIQDGPEARTRISTLVTKDNLEGQSAVSIVFSKRKGTNVVTLSKELLKHIETFKKSLPSEVKVDVVRDYGSTAEDKSKELIEHLIIATVSVSILIALAMGWRAAVVVATAIPVTLALTLAIYYFMGYTLNRVTLFALIFSIGILVDDAIVVVENIERYLKENAKMGLLKATLAAVSEVGNPTILATFTVIASILPMAFVQGLMGPYMKPIPVGASLAMILSLFVAFIVTPWASVRLLKIHESKDHENDKHEHKTSKLDQMYLNISHKLLGYKSYATGFGALVVGLFLLSSSLVYFKVVKVKMLPFDNKSEFQVILDYDPSTPLEVSAQNSKKLAQELLKNPNIEKIQIFAGEPAPFSFSGMVKHTFLRRKDYMSDLHIVMKDKHERKQSGHDIITDLRPLIQNFAKEHKAISKVLEIPPGPPVMATMVAEVYGPDRETRRKVGEEIKSIFENESSIVDLDYTWRKGRDRIIYVYDQNRGGELGTKAIQAVQMAGLVFNESSLVSLNDLSTPEEVMIDLSLNNKVRSSLKPFDGQNVPSFESGVVPLKQVLKEPKIESSQVLYRKNLKPVEYVLSEIAGAEEAPVYAMLKLAPQVKYPTQTAQVPWNTLEPVIKWDGEWFITYEVFRDLGAAFLVVMILIYVLVVGWFGSFLVPLVIMAPIPISLIGIIPGHALTGAYFTATSMIGFIAGAGIIVRNSIILVDFIEQQIAGGLELKEAVISAGLLRFRPMLLTAAAVVVGSAVMLFDPIFQGLAVSLMFGEIAATLLSRFAVPVLYYWFVGNSRLKELRGSYE